MFVTEKEVTGKEVDSLEPKKTYSGGNYTDLKTFLEKQTKKSDPKVCYDDKFYFIYECFFCEQCSFNFY